MEKAILEVLLVNTQALRHTNVFGRPAYYVIMECGNHVHRSKISLGGDEKTWWNEKFTFEFSLFEWKKRMTHLKIRIMDKELFSGRGFVGETIIYLGGIIAEGSDKGFIEVKPTPYNVVLEDDTYKGEIKIGFKFISDVSNVPKMTREYVILQNKPDVAFNSVMTLWKNLWWWSLAFPKRLMDSKNDKNNYS